MSVIGFVQQYGAKFGGLISIFFFPYYFTYLFLIFEFCATILYRLGFPPSDFPHVATIV